MVSINKEIQTRIRPNKTMVSAPPTNITVPVVLNNPAPVLAESKFKDLLSRTVAIRIKTNKTTISRNMKPTNFNTVFALAFCKPLDICVLKFEMFEELRLMPKSDRRSSKTTSNMIREAAAPATAAIPPYSALLNMPADL